MKKFLLAIALTLSLLSASQASAATVECHNFSMGIYHAQDAYYEKLADLNQYHKDWANVNAYMVYKNAFHAHVAALHKILAAEGHTIDAAEVKGRSIGRTTAAAIVKFQQANNILPIGWIDGDTMKVLNQKYGCIEKATVDLIEPNASVVKAKGEILPIKWRAAKIPNETTLNISYAKADGSGLTSIASTTIRNGAGSLLTWRIPETMTPGTYKIQLSLSGSVKSDISVKPFEVRDNTIEVLSPNGGEAFTVGQKTNITWKTSSAIKPSDLVEISLVSNQNGNLSTSTIITKNRNDGTYSWTIPDVFTGSSNASSETSIYRIFVSSLGFRDSTNEPGFTIAPANSANGKNHTTPTCPYTFTKNLTLGSTNSDVIALQNMLKFKGFFSGNSDGVFGQSTKSALAAYQTSKSISSDGFFGPATRALVNADCNSKLASKITLTSPVSVQSIGRGTNLTINWTANASIPAAAKVKILLVKNIGGATVATLNAGVAASAGTATVTIPANTIADAYKIVLVPVGVTLEASSVLTSGILNVTINSGTISTASTASEVFKGDTLSVAFTTSNVAATNDVTASVVTANNGATSVAKVKVKAGTGSVNIPIPANLEDGTYKVYLSTIVDGQNVSNTTGTFLVKTKPFIAPVITLTSPSSTLTIGRGSSMNVTWTVNSSVPETTKINVILVKNIGGATVATLKSGVPAKDGTTTVTIPANIIADAYKIVLVPSLSALTSASVLTSPVINVGIQSASFISVTGPTSPVYKGGVATITFTTSNVPATNDVTATVLFSTIDGATTNTKVKAKASAGFINIPIPATLEDGVHKVYLSTVVDGQNVSGAEVVFRAEARPNVAPLITLTAPSSQSVERGSTIAVNWTVNSSVPASTKIKILLVKNIGGATVATLNAGVTASAGTATVTIPANTIADAYKIVLVPSLSALTDASVLTSPVINVTINSGSFTSVTTSADVYKGDVLPVRFITSSVPATNDVTASVVTANNGATSVAKVKVKAGTGSVNIPIPANLEDGTYKVYLSTLVDRQNISGVSNTFTLKNGTATVNISGTPTLTIDGVNTKGLSTAMTAVFKFQVSAIGNTMTKPVAADFAVSFNKADGTAIASPAVTVTVSPNANIAKGNTATVTVKANIVTTKVPASGAYTASVKSIKTTVGGIATTQTTTYQTPSVNFVK